MKRPYLPVLTFILVVFLGNACKKDNKAIEAEEAVIVSLLNTGLQEEFIPYSAIDTSIYDVVAKMEGEPWAVPNKIIFAELDPALLTAYNAASGTNFQLLPDSVYSLAKATDTILTGFGQAPLPVQFFTWKINPYNDYVLPLKLTSAEINIDESAYTILVRVLLGNNYTGVYTDTVSSEAVPPTYPTPPSLNFTDSIVQKRLTAINDTTVIMDIFLPTLVPANQQLVMRIDTTANVVGLSVYNATPAEAIQFAAANAGLMPYYRKADKYFYIPYNYFSTDFRIKERLKKI